MKKKNVSSELTGARGGSISGSMMKKINITIQEWQLDVIDLIVNAGWEPGTNRSEVIRGLMNLGMQAARKMDFLDSGGGFFLSLGGLLDNVEWVEDDFKPRKGASVKILRWANVEGRERERIRKSWESHHRDDETPF